MYGSGDAGERMEEEDATSIAAPINPLHPIWSSNPDIS
jgi:hypothetical protein